MNKKIYRGEIYYAELNSVTGSEQGGKRPVVILQNNLGNKHSTTTIIAPISSNVDKKFISVHVLLTNDISALPKNSIVLLEQIRVIDKKRLKTKIAYLNRFIMEDIDRAIRISLGLKKEW